MNNHENYLLKNAIDPKDLPPEVENSPIEFTTAAYCKRIRLKAEKEGYDLSKYDDSYDDLQLSEIWNGLRADLNVSLYDSNKYSWILMMACKQALMLNLDEDRVNEIMTSKVSEEKKRQRLLIECGSVKSF